MAALFVKDGALHASTSSGTVKLLDSSRTFTAADRCRIHADLDALLYRCALRAGQPAPEPRFQADYATIDVRYGR